MTAIGLALFVLGFILLVTLTRGDGHWKPNVPLTWREHLVVWPILVGSVLLSCGLLLFLLRFLWRTMP